MCKIINYSIPGFWMKHDLVFYLLHLQQTRPEIFRSNIKIASVYDNFPNCIWNGGRVHTGTCSISQLQQLKTQFLMHPEVEFRLVFTNGKLEQKHCDDTYGNFLLKMFADLPNVSITVNSMILRDYIQNLYPNMRFNYSATRCMSNLEELNELSQIGCVIPSYQDLNNQWEKIEQLKHTHNIEFIVDEACVDDCPFRKSHYEQFDEAILFQLDTMTESIGCAYRATDPNQPLNYYRDRTTKKHNISPELIQNEYLPRNFTHFKITGRDAHFVEAVESFVYYLIKPEFKDEIRLDLLTLGQNK